MMQMNDNNEKRFNPNIIRLYLEENQDNANRFLSDLKELLKELKKTKTHLVKPKSSEFLNCVLQVLRLQEHLHSRLYPIWKNIPSGNNKINGQYAFDIMNSILNHKLLSCPCVSVYEIENQACFIDRIEMKEDSSITEWCHELGHWVEYHNDNVRYLCNIFLEYRTQNSELKTLPKFPYGGGKYKEGQFASIYCGKICGPWTKERYTEILSQGLQILLEGSYPKFYEDKEYIAFLLGILKGNIDSECACTILAEYQKSLTES